MEHPAQKRYHYLIHSLPCCFPTDETDEEEEIIEEYPQKETRRKKVRDEIDEIEQYPQKQNYSVRQLQQPPVQHSSPANRVNMKKTIKFLERCCYSDRVGGEEGGHGTQAYLQVLGNGVTSLER
ncbi:hypothetical protein PVAP13_2NG110200 [Panicum virgatum]|uniref:Uncharacterized protein n=1 Tax=Panicum virgatum TaxID=38727 RepID=A0A8T0V865_PANVG|nr:hypothetical protein PVAP13_2NG110200 [Panicum virgatum]